MALRQFRLRHPALFVSSCLVLVACALYSSIAAIVPQPYGLATVRDLGLEVPPATMQYLALKDGLGTGVWALSCVLLVGAALSVICGLVASIRRRNGEV